MIEFWLGLVIALVTHTATITESSSMTSDNPTPQVSTLVEWSCLPDFDETCFVVIVDDKIINTGP